METLIIGPAQFRESLELHLPHSTVATWANSVSIALEKLNSTYADCVVLDNRGKNTTLNSDLTSLISNVPLTTKIVAIVDVLPTGSFFSRAGVIYFTPPVLVTDICWLLKGGFADSSHSELQL